MGAMSIITFVITVRCCESRQNGGLRRQEITSDLRESRAHPVIVTEAAAEGVECSRPLEGGPVRVVYSHTQKNLCMWGLPWWSSG